MIGKNGEMARRLFVNLALSSALALAACGEREEESAETMAPSGEEERVNTMTAFEKGDIIVAATVMDVPEDDHAGTGRLLQYDSDMNLKGVLWTKGSTHKIGGLVFGPDKTLWAFAQGTPVVMEIDSSGVQRPVRKFSDRSYSSVTFGPDGSLYFGEHLQGTQRVFDRFTTQFHYLPGTEKVGDGNVFKHSPDGALVKEFNTDTHGGMLRFHGVTSTVLTDDGKRMIYISETGNRVLQYDLENDKQLPDLANFEGDDRVPMVLVMSQLLDGNLLITSGGSMIIMDQNTGEIVHQHALETFGWAAAAPTIDGKHVIMGNFFDGDVAKFDLETGEIVSRGNIGEEESLSGLAQFPG